MIVLDTNVVSELMRPRPAAQVLDWVDDQDAGELTITAITVAGLHYGVARLADGAHKRELDMAVRALVRDDFTDRVLSFDAAAAEHYARVAAEREGRGRPIGTADAQIAAICRSHGAALATRNVRDFEATGIHIVEPWGAG